MSEREKLLEIEVECQRVLIEIKHGFDTIGTEMLAQSIIQIINKSNSRSK